MSKPSIPQGTRDFSPLVVQRRQYILNTLKNIFEIYGFQPIETPAMENLSTLTGKYGEEGDRLIFKILNNGLHEQSDERKILRLKEWEKMQNQAYSSIEITERALRYDLTIPFARYVVMNQNDIALPFRRYQMQPVWRADRPQKGRYREFWQCDADVVGSNSLVNEAELFCIYQSAFASFKVPVNIKINSRKLLAGLAELCGIPNQLTDLTIALDKLDKIGWDGVMAELANRNIPTEHFYIIADIINNTKNLTDNTEIILVLKDFFKSSGIGSAGVQELETALKYYSQLTNNSTLTNNITIDVTLARGLNYYTGIIVEVVCTHAQVKMGSIGGGGRYDDLTGLFGLKGISGVGVSFGIDRIYDVIEELQLFPAHVETGTQALILNFGGENETYSLEILQQLRNAKIRAEIYPEASKFDKQMKYANKRGITYILLPGDEERKNNKVSLKNFVTGTQELMTIEECIAVITTL